MARMQEQFEQLLAAIAVTKPAPKKSAGTPVPATPKKEPKGTNLTGYMPIAKTCNNCRFITNDLTQCANPKVKQDSQITNGPNGLKNIAQTGWCNEWEAK